MNKYKYLAAGLALMGLIPSCADDFTNDFSVAKPSSVEMLEDINSYEPLKSYINRSQYPNFKLAGALSVGDFSSIANLSALAAANFDEVVAGNEMKYSSCVNAKGEMDFTTVENFVTTAQKYNVGIYGHTLAWHSQQQPDFLNSLLKDKDVVVEPDPNEAEVENSVYTCTFDDNNNIGGWGGESTREVTNDGGHDGGKCHVIHNPSAVNPWEVQAAIDFPTALEEGKAYYLRFWVKADITDPINASAGFQNPTDYSNRGDFPAFEVSSEWKQYELKTIVSGADCKRLCFSVGTIEGDIYFDDIEIYYMDKPANVTETETTVFACTFDDNNNVGGWGGESTREVTNDGGHDGGKCHKIHNPAAANPWEVQAAIDFETPLEEGEAYYLRFWVKADITDPIKASAGFQNPADYSNRGDFPAFEVSSEWKQYELKTFVSGADCKRLCFSVGTIEGDIYLDDIEIYYMAKTAAPTKVPLTDKEKLDTLSWAMGKWIEGMMNATNGYVKAWDVVNEPIAGEGDDGEGNYPLQHGTANADGIGGNSNVFFWQDFMGDLDYVRTAVKLARQHYKGEASDLKLFVNDYNLESDWDDNKKLTSLIAWINKWEADGVTKIDGIGTQMHISCYENESTNNSKKEHIAKMFELMAATGKLVRISELDMGYVANDGTSLQTETLTEEQHQQMADLYKFVVKTYMEKVPAAQQYGICQWCLTDSPKNSSWRGGQPTGLWTEKYVRKKAFMGFADGLSGK